MTPQDVITKLKIAKISMEDAGFVLALVAEACQANRARSADVVLSDIILAIITELQK
jgi:hypothetical protein